MVTVLIIVGMIFLIIGCFTVSCCTDDDRLWPVLVAVFFLGLSTIQFMLAGYGTGVGHACNPEKETIYTLVGEPMVNGDEYIAILEDENGERKLYTLRKSPPKKGVAARTQNGFVLLPLESEE